MIVNGFFDWADRMPGPPDKLWPATNAIDAVVFHSAVGTLQGVINVVMGPASNQRSVTGVIAYGGRLVQFYPVSASPWANGNKSFNERFLGFEFEGGADTPATVSEPLRPEQTVTAVRILRDLAAHKNVPVSFWQRPTTLKEHRELIATKCPSDRITWPQILEELQTPDLLNGTRVDGNFLYLYHDGVPIRRWGSNTRPERKGREAWNFGDSWYWMRYFLDDGQPMSVGYLSQTEGD